jgi:hypothetical protein
MLSSGIPIRLKLLPSEMQYAREMFVKASLSSYGPKKPLKYESLHAYISVSSYVSFT